MPQENKINLSLIIPVFNEKKFLPKLFDEIKNHFNDYKNEVIFIDDGSTDGSTNILKELEEKENYKSNRLIEEFMVLANNVVATHLNSNGVKSAYRNHENHQAN